jgi:DNA-binding transcriptional MerR regulator
VTKLYRVQEFAVAAGVTVRALHHYDRLALLKPRRTSAGYRLYSLRDLERLEQIAALKLLGLPLKEIKGLLDRDARALPDVLRAQRRALQAKRDQLDRVINAIREVEQAMEPGKRADPAMLTRLIEVIDMPENAEQLKKYYTDEAWEELTRRRETMTPDERKAAEHGTELWADLVHDIQNSLDEDPAGDKVQALVARWKQLVESFTGGNAAITDGLRTAWSDRQNWPTDLRRASEPFADQRVWEFIGRASVIGKARPDRS